MISIIGNRSSFVLGLMLLVVSPLLSTTVFVVADDAIAGIAGGDIMGEETFATCDGCWCIPDVGDSCPPQSEMPATTWDNTTIYNLLSLELANPFTLQCDPYNTSIVCNTSPTLVSGNTCTYEVFPREEFSVSPTSTTTSKQSNSTLTADPTCTDDYMYRLVTVNETVEEAIAAGMAVTHSGPCGACSTLQDLVVYMTKPDLTEIGTKCGARGLTNFTRGVECFKSQGFSPSCAFIWMANARYTKETCGPQCITHTLLELPNNGPPPTCYLAECIECDELSSGPLFSKFSGRTRRSSGLLSGIVRNCSSISSVVEHVDPCEYVNNSSNPMNSSMNRSYTPVSEDEPAALSDSSAASTLLLSVSSSFSVLLLGLLGWTITVGWSM